jgi:glycosyltransferase involved in cell wall biosynthesis
MEIKNISSIEEWDDGGKLTMRNGYPHLPKEKRKTIFLLSDDLRMSSGVGTMSREIVLGTAHYYNWIQIAGAINHPEQGKRVDVSGAVNEEIGIDDSYVMLYPMHGYGSIDIIRAIQKIENPDAIIPYTDPRFWSWLFAHELELRQKMPIFFYHVWDDIPFPKYNEFFYESCDWIGCISKQTYNIVKNVWKTNPPQPWQVTYIPHGINETLFYPVNEQNTGKLQKLLTGKKTKDADGKEVDEILFKTDFDIYQETKQRLLGNETYDFVVLYVNRNVRRKMTNDVILAFNKFCNDLPPEKAKRCALVMHTAIVDEAGTNLKAVIDDLEIKHRIVFSDQRIEPKFMNIIFNIADVTVNIASNEGFGLGTAESLMAGTPIVVNVTGGLSDQCGFVKDDGTYLTIDDYNESWGSNHDGRYTKHGEWVKPVFPVSLSLQGSVPTPYIMDDRCDWVDVAYAFRYWYDLGPEERKRCGLAGRDYCMNNNIGFTASEMCRRFIFDMDNAFKQWKPRKRFHLHKVEDKKDARPLYIPEPRRRENP